MLDDKPIDEAEINSVNLIVQSDNPAPPPAGHAKFFVKGTTFWAIAPNGTVYRLSLVIPQPAITNATTAAEALAKLNTLLGELRTAGIIST